MSKKKSKSKKQVENFQRLWEEDKTMTKEFYEETTSQIKSHLMKYLIHKGYYIDGVAQVNFSREDVDDCYTYVMNHVTGTFKTKNGKISKVKYDPTKGCNLATFVHTWSRGYCSTILSDQKKKCKYQVHKILVLDDILINYTPDAFIVEDVFNDSEDVIDKEIFLNNIVKQGIIFDKLDEFNRSDFDEYNSPHNINNTYRKLSTY